MFTNHNYGRGRETKLSGNTHYRCTKGMLSCPPGSKTKTDKGEDILRICGPATCESPPATCFLRGQSKGTNDSFCSERDVTASRQRRRLRPMRLLSVVDQRSQAARLLPLPLLASSGTLNWKPVFFVFFF